MTTKTPGRSNRMGAAKPWPLATSPPTTSTPAHWVASRDNGGTPGIRNAVSLPVELTRFFADPAGANMVLLTWMTATETNNAGFEVEMKRGVVRPRHAAAQLGNAENPSAWQTLAFVEGKGTTTEAQTYRYTVENLSTGIHTSAQTNRL